MSELLPEFLKRAASTVRGRVVPDTPERRYEALKAAWIRANPEASPREYEAAMALLARKAGI